MSETFVGWPSAGRLSPSVDLTYPSLKLGLGPEEVTPRHQSYSIVPCGVSRHGAAGLSVESFSRHYTGARLGPQFSWEGSKF